MTLPIQISGKVGDVIVVLGGTDPADFQNNVMSILGPEAGELIGSLFEQALIQKTAEGNVQAAMGPTQSPSAGAQSAQVPAGAAASGPANGTHTSETDKWGNSWTYNIPGAPSCAHGVRVQKKGTSQAGKSYTGWACPTQSPHAYRSKVTKAECAMEFEGRR